VPQQQEDTQKHSSCPPVTVQSSSSPTQGRRRSLGEDNDVSAKSLHEENSSRHKNRPEHLSGESVREDEIRLHENKRHGRKENKESKYRYQKPMTEPFFSPLSNQQFELC